MHIAVWLGLVVDINPNWPHGHGPHKRMGPAQWTIMTQFKSYLWFSVCGCIGIPVFTFFPACFEKPLACPVSLVVLADSAYFFGFLPVLGASFL